VITNIDQKEMTMTDKTVGLLLVCSFVCIEQHLAASVAALATILFAPVLRDWAKK